MVQNPQCVVAEPQHHHQGTACHSQADGVGRLVQQLRCLGPALDLCLPASVVRALHFTRGCVCVRVFMYVCVYVCLYVCVYLYVCMYIYVCVYVCMCVCIFMCVCVFVYMYVYLCVYVYVCVFVCVYVCVCVYLYVCFLVFWSS